ncbi:phytanoyl-CoA dioxygenase family protein [Actinoallomurus sp. NPDC052274]|uniref:phytanoyl-CoA dioxygenase family protein n=1 Tax=Actinoallomurus sp. NPDC052274 TaxID=3155420 RepID=UPI0034373747
MTNETSLSRFAEEGYAVLRGVLDESDLAPVRAEYAEALRSRARVWRTQGRFKGGEELMALPFEEHLIGLSRLDGFDPSLLAELDLTLPHMPFTFMRPDAELHTGPAVLGLLSNPKVLDPLRPLLGDAIKASPNQHCRLKLPVVSADGGFRGRVGETMHAPTMWHQDAMTQIPQSDDTSLVTCWIPTGDVDETHGCLKVVPGAHQNTTLLPWPMDDATTARLEDAAVSLPVHKGDVVLLHKRTPHGSTSNISPRVRWSLDFRYFPADQPTDRPWFPNIVVYDRAHPERTQSDAEDWRRQWIRARDLIVASGRPLPGRREFAQLVSDAMIRGWEAGDYLDLDRLLAAE